MAIYLNEGHAPSDGGKPFKHISGWCPLLQARSDEGHALRRTKNLDRTKPPDEQRWRRCPTCFVDLPRIHLEHEPEFLRVARQLDQESPSSHWVYHLHDAETRDSQVGKARSLHGRLASRWKATLKGGYLDDGIPWLNHRLSADSTYEPVLIAERYDDDASALAAEKQLRNRLRSEGWMVSSDV